MNKLRPTTHDAIIEAAFAVYAKTPTASLGDVAAQAGVGRATLHRHFPGRPQLMRALAEIAMDELNTAVEQATADAQSYAEGFRLSLFAIIPLANRQLFLANEGLDADPDLARLYATERAELLSDIAKAQDEVTAMCDALLANTVIERYEVELL